MPNASVDRYGRPVLHRHTEKVRASARDGHFTAREYEQFQEAERRKRALRQAGTGRGMLDTIEPILLGDH